MAGVDVSLDGWYPDSGLAVYRADARTVRWVGEYGARTYAEVGVWKGQTALKVAQVMDSMGGGYMWLFDFEDVLADVVPRVQAAAPDVVVIAVPNSRKGMDSYCWSLAKLLERRTPPRFDYVYLDGAHTFATDALAFALIDRMLAKGGFVDFDDEEWTLANSPSMNPDALPITAELFTPEQIKARQVRMVMDLFPRADPRYEEVVRNRLFRKVRA